MAKALALTAPRTLRIVEVPDEKLAAQQVRVQTHFSGISAGTEMTQYRGTNPYLYKQWDAASRLFRATPGSGENRGQPYPLIGWGYEEVGQIVELGSGVTSLVASGRLGIRQGGIE